MSEVVYEQLGKHRIIPIATAELTVDNADAVGDALVAGGLPLIEVTLRTPGAIGAAAKLVKRGDILVSTGTILTLDQARASLDAGVHYMVSPGLDMTVVEWAQTHDLPIIPGATTASEITRAYAAGLRTLKFFPAEAAGGVAAMELLAGPFPGVRFVPTGGITFDMLKTYLKAKSILATGQGSLLSPATLKEKRWSQVEADVKRAAGLTRSA